MLSTSAPLIAHLDNTGRNARAARIFDRTQNRSAASCRIGRTGLGLRNGIRYAPAPVANPPLSMVLKHGTAATEARQGALLWLRIRRNLRVVHGACREYRRDHRAP